MDNTKNYIESMKSKYSISHITRLLDKLKNLRILVIGDTIIDHYVFVKPKGRAIKDPILSVAYDGREVYPGGILAIANHLSDFVKDIKLVTLLGDRETHLDFIKQSLRDNVVLKTFTKKAAPTTVKKRMVDFYRGNKLFKIEYLDDKPIRQDVTAEIIAYLTKELKNYDLIIVGDFGHGFINNSIKRILERESKFLAVNAQSNSSTMGYNYFSLYNRIDFISMNGEELRLPLSRRFEDLSAVISEAHDKFMLNNFIVTVGKEGCIFARNGKIFNAPSLVSSVKDTVGSGDALFAIASLFVYAEADEELIPFMANCAGGIAVNILGNKDSVTKHNLISFIKHIYEDTHVCENGLGNL